MTVPTINALINFSTGPSFAQAMILDTGLLGTNVLADAQALIVDVSNVVDGITNYSRPKRSGRRIPNRYAYPAYRGPKWRF